MGSDRDVTSIVTFTIIATVSFYTYLFTVIYLPPSLLEGATSYQNRWRLTRGNR